jgi:short-subunit dehydrogenase
MSTAANVAKAGEAIYCAAKWGAKGFTESLRLETKGSRVRILSVYPGGMDTPFWAEAPDVVSDTSNLMNPKEVAEIILANLQSKPSLQVTELTNNRL